MEIKIPLIFNLGLKILVWPFEGDAHLGSKILMRLKGGVKILTEDT